MRAKRNSSLLQRMSSSHRRDMCMATVEQQKRYSSAKSRSETPSMEFPHTSAKPSRSAV